MGERGKDRLVWLLCFALVLIVFFALRDVIANQWLRMLASAAILITIAIAIPAVRVLLRPRSDAADD